jgi:hypothetical protein
LNVRDEALFSLDETNADWQAHRRRRMRRRSKGRRRREKAREGEGRGGGGRTLQKSQCHS